MPWKAKKKMSSTALGNQLNELIAENKRVKKDSTIITEVEFFL